MTDISLLEQRLDQLGQQLRELRAAKVALEPKLLGIDENKTLKFVTVTKAEAVKAQLDFTLFALTSEFQATAAALRLARIAETRSSLRKRAARFDLR